MQCLLRTVGIVLDTASGILVPSVTPLPVTVMPFVKIDCGILDSTVWIDLPLRNVFLTALLMAEPAVYDEPVKQISVDSLSFTGWEAPPGWYGFVPSSGIGIIRRADVDSTVGMKCLHTLGEPELSSRSQKFDGRRMIRIDGGYLILNYDDYRTRDYTAAERMRRYREKKKGVTRNVNAVTRHVTQAEAEADSKEYLRGEVTIPLKSELASGNGKGPLKSPSTEKAKPNGLPKTERDSWDLRRWREAREGLTPQAGNRYHFLDKEEKRKADLKLDRDAAFICGISIERLQELIRPFYEDQQYVADLLLTTPLLESAKAKPKGQSPLEQIKQIKEQFKRDPQ